MSGPNAENERADAGRDSRTRLARSNSQARTGTGKHSFSCLTDHERHWQPCPVDPSCTVNVCLGIMHGLLHTTFIRRYSDRMIRPHIYILYIYIFFNSRCEKQKETFGLARKK